MGGNQSSALGFNTPGQTVGYSTVSDGSVHAFVHVYGQMFDLNNLCDLSSSDFRVLTVAKAINDSLVIVGEGITNDGAKHAFMLSPIAVDGGQWSYLCGGACQPDRREGEWVWIQIGGFWWWESGCGCYRALSASLHARRLRPRQHHRAEHPRLRVAPPHRDVTLPLRLTTRQLRREPGRPAFSPRQLRRSGLGFLALSQRRLRHYRRQFA